jgi:DNA polymerase V
LKQKTKLTIFKPDTNTNLKLQLFSSTISAGFPSPAEDYVENELDLNKMMIDHPAATFFVKVKGDSMLNASINDGDILVVDRAKNMKKDSIVIAFLDGEFTVKRIIKERSGTFLQPENPKYKPIKVTSDMDFKVWGIVTYVIKNLSGF